MSADWMRKLIWMQIQLLWKIGSVSDEGRGASSGVPPRKDLPFRDSGNEPERARVAVLFCAITARRIGCFVSEL